MKPFKPSGLKYSRGCDLTRGNSTILTEHIPLDNENKMSVTLVNKLILPLVTVEGFKCKMQTYIIN